MSFYSTGSAANNDSTDEDYISHVIESKPQSQAPAASGPLPIEQIEASLQTRVYTSERGSPQFFRELNADVGFCAFETCRYESVDREQLRQHYHQHDEIASFRESVYKETRRHENLHERRAALQDGLERLRTELKTLDEEISSFDKKSLARRQAAVSRLTILGI